MCENVRGLISLEATEESSGIEVVIILLGSLMRRRGLMFWIGGLHESWKRLGQGTALESWAFFQRRYSFLLQPTIEPMDSDDEIPTLVQDTSAIPAVGTKERDEPDIKVPITIITGYLGSGKS